MSFMASTIKRSLRYRPNRLSLRLTAGNWIVEADQHRDFVVAGSYRRCRLFDRGGNGEGRARAEDATKRAVRDGKAATASLETFCPNWRN